MIKLYQRYVGFNYFKNFSVIFLALEFFYVGIDLVTNLKDLPDSANLQLLYVSFNALTAINYSLPLAIVFGMIVTKFTMIRSNELICMHATGLSKRQLVFPVFIIGMLLTILYVSLNMTSFAYAYEYRSNLLKYGRIASISSDLFLKYEGKYVYFKSLDPIKKEARDIKIFRTNETELTDVVEAKRGIFVNDAWRLYDVKIVKKPQVKHLIDSGLKISEHDTLVALKGFRPKIIDNVYQGDKAFSIIDAIDAIRFFSTQGVNISSIKSNLYLLAVFPFFAPLMVVILYFYLPFYARFFNLALLSFGFVFVTLSVWGLLFILSRFSISSVILPEIGIVLPIIIMLIFAIFQYSKNR